MNEDFIRTFSRLFTPKVSSGCTHLNSFHVVSSSESLLVLSTSSIYIKVVYASSPFGLSQFQFLPSCLYFPSSSRLSLHLFLSGCLYHTSLHVVSTSSSSNLPLPQAFQVVFTSSPSRLLPDVLPGCLYLKSLQVVWSVRPATGSDTHPNGICFSWMKSVSPERVKRSRSGGSTLQL